MVKHLATARLNVGDDLVEFTLSDSAVAKIPKFKIDEKDPSVLEVDWVAETLFAEANSDSVSRLNSADRLNHANKSIVGRSLLPGRWTALVGIQAVPEIAHVVAGSEENQRSIRITRYDGKPKLLPLLLQQRARHLNA